MTQQEIITAPKYRREFKRLWKTMTNKEISEHFNISITTLHCIKRKLKLKCTPEMQITRFKKVAYKSDKMLAHWNNTELFRRMGKKNFCAYLDKLRNREVEHPRCKIKREDPERSRRLAENMNAVRWAKIREERRRVELGLTPKTNEHPVILGVVKKLTRQQVNARHLAYKRGYSIPDSRDLENRMTLWYDEDTQRGKIAESNWTKLGFNIQPLTETN